MTQTEHKKFDFGTVFGDGGTVREAPRVKRSYTPEEVEAIRAEAFIEGENSALARTHIANAAAVQALSEAAQHGLAGLTEAIHAHRQSCVELALMCARKIATEALDRFGEAPVQAALSALAQELENTARLVLFAPQMTQTLKDAATDAAHMGGFTGQIVFREDARLPKGAFEVVWSDGRAEFNPQQIEAAITQALNEALEAEAYHHSLAVRQAAGSH